MTPIQEQDCYITDVVENVLVPIQEQDCYITNVVENVLLPIQEQDCYITDVVENVVIQDVPRYKTKEKMESIRRRVKLLKKYIKEDISEDKQEWYYDQLKAIKEEATRVLWFGGLDE